MENIITISVAVYLWSLMCCVRFIKRITPCWGWVMVGVPVVNTVLVVVMLVRGWRQAKTVKR